MITMEPMNCAVDDRTFDILFHWFGREITDKLLYEGDAYAVDHPPLGDDIAPDHYLFRRETYGNPKILEPAAHSLNV